MTIVALVSLLSYSRLFLIQRRQRSLWPLLSAYSCDALVHLHFDGIQSDSTRRVGRNDECAESNGLKARRKTDNHDAISLNFLVS